MEPSLLEMSASSHQPSEALGRKLNHSKLLEKIIAPLQIRTFTAIQPKESYGNVQHEKNTSGSFH